MEFITQGNRIAVENFDKGKLYTVLWKNDTQENLMCISIGADCVVFQGEAPVNLFTLSMRNADTIDSIEPTQLGTTNYNNLINKPQINGVDLIGNKTGTQLGLASQSDLEDYATNASVVAGLATKQDALSSSQLAAVNSGITSEDVEQITTNKNNISLLETMNGAKNLSPWSGGSINTNGYVVQNYPLILSAGKYYIFFNTSATSSVGEVIFGDGSGRVGSASFNHSTDRIVLAITLSRDSTTMTMATSIGTTITNYMLITKAAYDAGFTDYQPYAMSNVELTAAIQSLQAQLANQ